MAKANLLKTTTNNYLELVGNGRIYRVPPFQRDYSWKEEHWEDLWNDIVEVYDKNDEGHYMGAIVIQGISDREYMIIDGQQRLATLSLLALAIIKRIQYLSEGGIEVEENQERIELLRARFLGDKDPTSLTYSSKLFLNQNDNDFYQDYLLQLRTPPAPKRLPSSNKALWDAFSYFLRKVEGKEGLRDSGQELAKILNESVARQLLFISIAVEDEVSAYTVFETLNARGLELSSTDLLKNYLFSRVKGAQDLKHLQARWKCIIDTVGQTKFPDFLRYYLSCSHRQIRKQRLFKVVRAKVRSPEDVFELLTALEECAELFRALGDYTHEFWLSDKDRREYIRILNLFGVRQMTPVLFSAYSRFTPSDFTRLLKLFVVITFRYTIVCNRNTNPLEPVYNNTAAKIISGEISSVAQAFINMKSIYVGDENFRSDFLSMSIETAKKKKLTRYILSALETDLSGKRMDFESDPASIEHILPENPGSEWDEAFPDTQHLYYVYRLGNLTLLEEGLNREAGISCYDDKKDIYRRSAYALCQSVNAPEWSPAAIEDRQRKMAERAAHIWKSDF